MNAALGTATNGGGVASACLSLNKTEPAMFTEEMYQKLREWLNRGCEYKYLRREYEELRRPWNNYLNLGDVWHFEGVSVKAGDFPTPKPEPLIAAIIEISSRLNDTILIPFAGSGTDCAVATKLGRKWYASEIDPKHFTDANIRVSKAKTGIVPRTKEEVQQAGGQLSILENL